MLSFDSPSLISFQLHGSIENYSAHAQAKEFLAIHSSRDVMLEVGALQRMHAQGILKSDSFKYLSLWRSQPSASLSFHYKCFSNYLRLIRTMGFSFPDRLLKQEVGCVFDQDIIKTTGPLRIEQFDGKFVIKHDKGHWVTSLSSSKYATIGLIPLQFKNQLFVTIVRLSKAQREVQNGPMEQALFNLDGYCIQQDEICGPVNQRKLQGARSQTSLEQFETSVMDYSEVCRQTLKTLQSRQQIDIKDKMLLVDSLFVLLGCSSIYDRLRKYGQLKHAIGDYLWYYHFQLFKLVQKLAKSFNLTHPIIGTIKQKLLFRSKFNKHSAEIPSSMVVLVGMFYYTSTEDLINSTNIRKPLQPNHNTLMKLFFINSYNRRVKATDKQKYLPQMLIDVVINCLYDRQKYRTEYSWVDPCRDLLSYAASKTILEYWQYNEPLDDSFKKQCVEQLVRLSDEVYANREIFLKTLSLPNTQRTPSVLPSARL